MKVEQINPPASAETIEEVERQLGLPFPQWLREVYLACDGFTGPTGVRYLYPLLEPDGALEFTQFLRREPYWPSWLERAIIFSDNGIGGTLTVHWCALDGQLIEWCYGDADALQVLHMDLFALWKREQQDHWDRFPELRL